MMFGLLGAMAMAPMFSERSASVMGVLFGVVFVVAGRWSVNGVQWAPQSSDRQTPPLAAVTKIRFGLVGSTATPETRPLTVAWLIVPPLSCAAGPIAVQSGVCGTWVMGSILFSRIVLDGTVRSSHRSTNSR